MGEPGGAIVTLVHVYRCDWQECKKEAAADMGAGPNYPHKPFDWITVEHFDFCSYGCLARYAQQQQGVIDGTQKIDLEGNPL